MISFFRNIIDYFDKLPEKMKSRFFSFFTLIIITILFSACHTSSPNNEIKTFPLPQQTVTEPQDIITKTLVYPTFTQTTIPVSVTKVEKQITPSIRITPSLDPSSRPNDHKNTQYILDVELDYETHQLKVKQQINYYNRTSGSLDNLILMVEPKRYTGAFEIKQITWKDHSLISNFTWRNTQLVILLPEICRPDQSITINLEYELFLPQTDQYANIRPRPFGYTARQLNLGDWYPFIPPYHHENGWLAHEPGYYGEYLVYDKADYIIDIELINPIQNLVIASSAGVATGVSNFHFELINARSFALSISPFFQVEEMTIENPNGSKVDVFSYFFPLDAIAGKRVLETTAQALQVYSSLFGDYPHNTMNAVQADFLDGMEYDGLYFLSKDFYNWHNGAYQDFLVTISAHETAHQWWYGIVGNDQAIEPWLDEALCTYSEHIFFENIYPDALDWWWTYRINYYQPHGKIDIDIYSINQDMQSYYNDYRDVVYLNGALFLEELRNQIGDESFFLFFYNYREQFKDKQVNSQLFWNLLKKHTENDLDDLIDYYFSQSQ